MKILFLTRRFWPEIGGVEKHCLEVSKKLIDRGHCVTVVTEAGANLKFEILNFKSISKYQNIKINRITITLGEKLKKFQIWKWMWNNRYLIKEADIIHCHDVFFWYLPFRFIFPKKKVYITFHGYEGNKPPDRRKIFMHRLAGWLTDGNITIGEFHQKWYGVKPDYVSYGGVNINKGKEGNRENKGGNDYDFCFVGRLSVDTGIMIYLKTLKILKDKGKDFSLVVCGGGPEEQEGKDFCIKNNINAKFLGFVRNPEEYIKISKYIFVSGYLGILEAMIAKKLVFSVFSNNMKEDYLKMTPYKDWIVIEKDPEILADKIGYYINHAKERNGMIAKGYNWAKEQSWEKVTEIYMKLWSANFSSRQ